MQHTVISITQIELNTGQIEGLPKNPRFIRDIQFDALKDSITAAPELLKANDLLVYQKGKKYVVIAGNMRLRACKELGYNEMYCCIIPSETTVEELKRYAIAHNINRGEWDNDMLLEDWSSEELEEFGLDLELGQDFSNTQTETNLAQNKFDASNNEIDYSVKNKEIDTSEFPSSMTIKLNFTEHDFHRVKDMLSELGITAENALFKFLFNEDIRAFNKRADLPNELYDLDILDGSRPCHLL